MIPTPLAFSPGSVTCFFLPNMGTSLADTSSPGCGICISHGVTAAIRPLGMSQNINVLFNGQAIDFPPVRGVIRELAPEPVEDFWKPRCLWDAASASVRPVASPRHSPWPAIIAWKSHAGSLGEVVLEQEIRHRTGIGDPVTQLHGGAVRAAGKPAPSTPPCLN